VAICLGGATFLSTEQFGNKKESDYINDIKGMVELLLDRVLVLFESQTDCERWSTALRTLLEQMCQAFKRTIGVCHLE